MGLRTVERVFLETSRISIGIDVVDIDRFEEVIKRRPRFAEKYFHEEELKVLEKKKNFVRHLAGRFAAKEAVVKAMGTGFCGFSLKEILILSDNKGRPVVRITGKALEVCESLGIREFAVSISFSKNNAVASCVALKAGTDESSNASDKKS